MLGPLLAMPSGQGLNMTLLAILKVNGANLLLVLEIKLELRKNVSTIDKISLLVRQHYLLDQVPTTLLTFVTQPVVTTLLSSFLSYWYYWCSMVCIKELHSQQFVLPKPRFIVARKILAMEVHKPQCHFAAEYDWSIETHLEKVLFFRFHENHPMKMSFYCGKTRKRPNFGFATVPYSFFWKHVLLRTWFPVRREIYASDPLNSKPTKRTTIWTLTLTNSRSVSCQSSWTLMETTGTKESQLKLVWISLYFLCNCLCVSDAVYKHFICNFSDFIILHEALTELHEGTWHFLKNANTVHLKHIKGAQ